MRKVLTNYHGLFILVLMVLGGIRLLLEVFTLPVSAQVLSQVGFLYDGAGQRIAKLPSGNHVYYVSPLLEVTVTPTGQISWRKNYTFSGSQIAVREGNSTASTVSYLHQDHLGSTGLTTNQAGQVVSQENYYPYGTTRSVLGTAHSERQYTGQVSDTDQTGLYYYNARYYDPQIGKFTQADSMKDGLNAYAYVGNNPITRTDPTGNMMIDDARGGHGGGRSGGGHRPRFDDESLGVEAKKPWEVTYQSMNAYNEIMLEETLPDVAPILVTSSAALPAAAACAANPICAALALKALGVLETLDTLSDVGQCAAGDQQACVFVMDPTLGAGIADDLTRAAGYVDQVPGFIASMVKKQNPETAVEELMAIADFVDEEFAYDLNYIGVADAAQNLDELWQLCGGVCRHNAPLVTAAVNSAGYPAWNYGFMKNADVGHAVTLVNLGDDGYWVISMAAKGPIVEPFELYKSSRTMIDPFISQSAYPWLNDFADTDLP